MKTILLLTALALLSAGCAAVPLTGRQQLSIVPQSELVEAAGRGYDELLGASKLSQDSESTAAGSRDRISPSQ